MIDLSLYADYLKARFNVADERGATAVEYGLVVAMVAGIIAVAVAAFGNRIGDWLDGINPSGTPMTRTSGS